MPKKKNLLTKKQMEVYYGSTCPRCRSDNIESGDREYPDNKTMIQEVSCPDCKLEWSDIFKLTGILEGSVKG